jgi:hypothetical protein
MFVDNFVRYSDGIEAAELAGDDASASAKRLGQYSAFTSITSADSLSRSNYASHSRVAMNNSGAYDCVMQVRDHDSTVDSVLFSRSGALAVRILDDAPQDALELARCLTETMCGVPVHASMAGKATIS